MFDKDKLESAFNVVVKYGFCSDCRWEFDSEKCHQFDCYENSVKIIRETIDFAINNGVKHGRWLINSDGYYPYCSECKCEPDGRKMSKYCPHCGVKMDGDKFD